MKKGKSKRAKSKPVPDSPERYRKGWFRTETGSIARFESDTPDEYDQAKEVIEAGFRIRNNAAEWGMNPDDYWQLACFPADPDDWKARMERLTSHSLHDKDASDLGSLMHSCTWTIEQLWKWLHHLAEHAQNSNIKRDAGQTLGKFYHHARQREPEGKLSDANSEFKRAINPFPWGARKPPAPQLVHWVNWKMRHHMEFWKHAVEVADCFERKKYFARDAPDSKGVHYYTRLPMGDLAEAWRSYFIQERQNHPHRSGSWRDFLDKLERHPFCAQNVSLVQLTDFDSIWLLALYDIFQVEWKADDEIKKVCSGRFDKKFGDLKHKSHMEGAGYQLAKDFFKRFYLSHWNNKQQSNQILESMGAARKQRRAEAKAILASDSANQKKASAG